MLQSNFSFNYGGKPFAEWNPVVTENERETTWALEDGLKVTMQKKEYPEFSAIEWVLYFENTGAEDSRVLSDLWDCDTVIPMKPITHRRDGNSARADQQTCVITMQGCVNGGIYRYSDEIPATEYSHHAHYLWGDNVYSIVNTFGRPSEGEAMPFFDVRDGKDGALVAIGWTGNWKAEFSRDETGATVRTGLPFFNLWLHPGEKIRTSAVLMMEYQNCSREEASNRFRRLMRRYHSVEYRKNNRLMANEFWGGLDSSEMCRRLNILKECGFRMEQTWLDAGWYGEAERSEAPFRPEWAAWTGDWNVNPRCHPDGLHEVDEACRAAGMPMMLWIEPERCRKQLKIVQEHPEYFLEIEENENALIDYSNPDAWQYAYDTVCHYVEDLHLACYRQDFNITPQPHWAKADQKDGRIGMHEVKHVMGLYRLWDSLLEKYPDLIIDNCSGGGRRFDFETVSRAIAFFRSDFQCMFNAEPDVLQCHQVNSSFYLPNMGCTTKILKDDYAVRSSYNASWGLACWNAVFQHVDEEGLAWMKKVVAEYRTIRDYFSADFYNHGATSFEQSAWSIQQYNRPEESDGMVLAFRRVNSPSDTVAVSLKGLDPEKNYVCTDLDTGETVRFSGKDATRLICIANQRESKILLYHAE